MPNSDLKVLGEKVRKERKLAGLTQEQLAERCHVSTKHIANIEKGSMNPFLDNWECFFVKLRNIEHDTPLDIITNRFKVQSRTSSMKFFL